MTISTDTTVIQGVRKGLEQVKSLFDSLITDINAEITALNLDSGTYTPTLTNTTNVAASTAYLCQYMRIGSVVTVSGKVDIDTTSTGNTLLEVSLPIASNLANTQNLAGTFANDANDQQGAIYGNTTNDRAILRYQASSTTNTGFFFTFTYQII